MQSKDYIFPFVVIPVGIAFLIVTAFVFFSNGKSARLIRYKLKIGAFLLSFSWFASLTAFAQDNSNTCYNKPPEALSELDLKYNFQAGGKLIGSIRKASKGAYTFKITNSKKKILKEDLLIIHPGASTEIFDKFRINLDPMLKKGTYTLEINLTQDKKSRKILRTKFKIK